MAANADVRDDISYKLRTGVYTLILKEKARSPVWSLFAMIADPKSGFTIDDYICCSSCGKLFKYTGSLTSNMYTHPCYLELKAPNTNCKEDNKPVSGDDTNSEVDDSSEVGDNPNKIKHDALNIKSLWDTFGLTLKYKPDITEAVITCTYCQQVIDYNNTQFPVSHKCPNGNKRDVPTHYQIVEKLKIEVRKQINAGLYKVQMKPFPSLKIWNSFAEIIKENGTPMPDYFICIKCGKLFKSNRKANGLYRHKCAPGVRNYMEMLQVKDKIKDGTYRIVPNKSLNPIWNRFALISRQNGECIVGRAYCRNCGKVLKYKEEADGEEKLKKHICLDKSHFSGSIDSRENCVDNDTIDVNENTKWKLLRKLEHGIYKPRMKSNDSDPMWKLLAMIENEKGIVVCGYLYCTRCKSLLKYKESEPSRVKCHKCVKNLQQHSNQQDTENSNITIATDNSSQEAFVSASKKRKVCVNDASDTIVVLSNKSSKDSVLSMRELSKPNVSEVDQDSIWSRFEHISLGEGTAYQGVVSCRHCKMMLVYDGITQFHLKGHKCFSMASLSTSCNALSDLEVIHNSKHPEKTGERKEILIESQTIKVKTEHDSAILNKSKNESLGTPISHKVYRCDIISSEAIQIKKEETNVEEMQKSLKESQSICKEETTRDEIICLDSPETFNKEDKENDIKETINVLLNWITEDFVPSHNLESTAFRKLLSHWLTIGAKYGGNIGYANNLPDCRKISKHIKEMADITKSKIKLKIKEKVKNLTISIDFWPEYILKRSFISATLHTMENNEMKPVVIGVKSMSFSNTNNETIGRKLENLLYQFGLDNLKNLVIVSENDYIQLNDGSTYLKCSSHLFNQVLNTTLETTKEMAGIIEQAKVIWKYMESSNIVNTLITPQLRSNSNNSLIKTISYNWINIHETISPNKESLGITDAAYSCLQSLVKLYQKFAYISKRLQETKSPSLCFVVPSVQRLQMMCESDPKDNTEIKAFKLNLLKNIEEIWISNINIWHKAACFLYPPANQEQQHNLAEIKEFCINRIKELNPNEVYSEFAETTDKEHCIETEPDDMDFFFPNLSKRCTVPIANNAEEEINRYSLKRITIDRNFNVLQWWRNNEKEYPRLSRLALQVLNIPASTGKVRSMPNENVFGLNPKNMEYILFLNSSMQR